jgi:hypothetical protein
MKSAHEYLQTTPIPIRYDQLRRVARRISQTVFSAVGLVDFRFVIIKFS